MRLREKPLAHTRAQAADTEDLLAAEQTKVVALRARASDAEAAKSHALKAQRVDDRQRAAAEKTAWDSCATTEQTETAHAAMPVAREGQAEAERAAAVHQADEPRGDGVTAAQGRLEEQRSEATVLIAALRSELKTLAAVGTLSRKQSAAQAKST